MHAGMLAALFFNSHWVDERPRTHQDFMIVDRETYERRQTANLIASLTRLATNTKSIGKKRKKRPRR
jgi:hypothetical protein